ncbi:hypothetical protein N1027_16080 [Herbiconiux sp. CPCC 205763]|uniref:Uncharacterized protein n=1 Tax=Herbiconiux aconitum TaxID=2970913 RepID=A0ABT2GTV5_9MICO|nr:hypothetical protein [Herbiconiux aconitum]MCS5719651.1 hypothetical protein [Herbiconiux aconitum]
MSEQGESFGRAATRRYQLRLLVDEVAAIDGLLELLEIRRARVHLEVRLLLDTPLHPVSVAGD